MSHTPRRIGVLGAGGLGRSAVHVLSQKNEFLLTAIADSHGIAHRSDGITPSDLTHVPADGTVAAIPGAGRESADPIGDMIALNKAGLIEAVFLAIPNIPNDFIPKTIGRFCAEGFTGVAVDALKRTSAVSSVMALAPQIEAAGFVYITGAGATPGLLTAAANLAAQSFQEVENVDINFGVGIANWDAYRATIREDIAHMPGYSVDRVKTMSDDEITRLLDDTNGIIELRGMEHADDIILEKLGVLAATAVEVGGVVDTRNAVKPVSTRMTLTGTTFEGKRSSHTFTLGDDTSMAANVLGPAFGWMKAGLELQQRGIRGLFTCAELMPKFVR